MDIFTDERLKKELEAFRKAGKRNRDKYENLTSVVDKKSSDAAVDLAYIDAQRTMKGIGKNFPQQKSDAINDIKEALHKYFSDPAPESETAFDSVHKSLCNTWCKKFNGSDIGTYGKAQKIINMAFKYLFCCNDAKEYRAHFKYCHMPLDSITLEWYKRKVDVEKKEYTWSKIKYNEYVEIQKNIRDYLNGSADTPLVKEFKVWPETQKELAAEVFLSGLRDDLSLEKMWDMSLNTKYEHIIDALKSEIEKSK